MVQLTRTSRRVRRFLGSRSDGRRRPGWCGRMKSAVGGSRPEHHSRPDAAGNSGSRTTSDCGTDRDGWWMWSTRNSNCASVAVSLPCGGNRNVSPTRFNLATNLRTYLTDYMSVKCSIIKNTQNGTIFLRSDLINLLQPPNLSYIHIYYRLQNNIIKIPLANNIISRCPKRGDAASHWPHSFSEVP